MGRRRHRARPVRGWWAVVAVAVVAALGGYYLISSPSSPGGADSVRTAAGRTGSPSPTGSAASPPATATPSPSPSRTASASPAAHRPTGRPGGAAPTPGRTAGGAPKSGRAPGGARTITVVNRTQQTVWAVVTNSAAYPDGRKLLPGQSTSVSVGNTWGGRIWGRTGCDTGAQGTCLTGDCTSGCTGANPPTTLGEFTFDAFDGLDFYDVSMVDGANLPMYINISHTVTADPVSASGCYKGRCTRPVDCPAAMRATSGGRVTGCEPPCAAFGGDTYCCRGAWAGRANCVPAKWPVDYTQVFKRAAPYAYSYAFDDAATMSCKGSCDYRVTFGVT